MKHASRPQSISWFQEQYKAGRLQLRPPFQRKPVWSEKQRCALIESILLEIPIPEIYVQVTQDDDGTEAFGVVDGQQRLRTILQFVGIERDEDRVGGNDNNFTLSVLPEGSPLQGKTFADVTGELKKRFFQYEICVRLLYTEDIREVEEVFKRLNKYVTPLRPQELRNATYHGAFAKLSEALANDDYWAVNRIVSPAAIRRMTDIEMMSDLLIGLLHGPQGGSAKIIDQYYEQYESFDDEFPEQNRVTRDFGRAHSTVKRIFPELSDVARWGNKADFYSLFVAFGNVLQKKDLPQNREGEIQTILVTFAEEVNVQLTDPAAPTSEAAKTYARAIEKGSNDKARRLDRHDALVTLINPILRNK